MPEDQVEQDNPPIIDNILERYPRRKSASPQSRPVENSRRDLLEKTTAKLAAQKLAGMEVKIADLVRTNQINSSDSHFGVTRYQQKEEAFDISGEFDELPKTEGVHVNVSFSPFKGGLLEEISRKLGVDAQFVLTIHTNTEEQIPENLPRIRENGPLVTEYFFDTRGNFGKVSGLLINDSDPRESLNTDPNNKNEWGSYRFVESEMTPSDFELAGTALTLMLNKAKPQTPQTPEP